MKPNKKGYILEIPNGFFASLPKVSEKEFYRSPYFIKSPTYYFDGDAETWEDVTEYADYMMASLISIDFRDITHKNKSSEYLELILNITRNIFFFKNLPMQIKDSACRRMFDMSRHDIKQLTKLIKKHFLEDIQLVLKRHRGD